MLFVSKLEVSLMLSPCHDISNALLAKITEALFASYRMRLESQSSTVKEYL